MTADEPDPAPHGDPVDGGAPGGPTEPPSPSSTDRRPPGPADRPLPHLPPPEAEPDGDPAGIAVGVESTEGTDGVEVGEVAVASVDGFETAPEPEGSAGTPGAAGSELLDGPAPAPGSPPVDLVDLDDPWADRPGEDDAPDLGGRPDPAPTIEPVGPSRSTGPAPDRHHARSGLLVAAVVVAIVASVLALAKAQQVGDLATQRDDRRAIEDVAGRFGAAYLSFDFSHAARSRDAVTALATRSFGSSYSAQRAPGIRELFSSGQTRTTARTTDVFVGRVEADRARAMVVVDVEARSPGDGTQRLHDVSFVLELHRTGDGWRVAKVSRAPQPNLDPGPSTTTTTAG